MSPMNGHQLQIRTMTGFITFVFVLALSAAAQAAPKHMERRTTWPTETGTMVRILRKDPSVADDGYVMVKRGPHDYIMKRNIFLRTSRSGVEDFSSDPEEVEVKRSGRIPKRDSAKAENPFLFRTSKRAAGMDADYIPWSEDDQVRYIHI